MENISPLDEASLAKIELMQDIVALSIQNTVESSSRMQYILGTVAVTSGIAFAQAGESQSVLTAGLCGGVVSTWGAWRNSRHAHADQTNVSEGFAANVHAITGRSVEPNLKWDVIISDNGPSAEATYDNSVAEQASSRKMSEIKATGGTLLGFLGASATAHMVSAEYSPEVTSLGLIAGVAGIAMIADAKRSFKSHGTKAMTRVRNMRDSALYNASS